jgi:hypothetical protein
MLSPGLEEDTTISGTVEGLNGAPGIAASVALYSTTHVFQTKANANVTSSSLRSLQIHTNYNPWPPASKER